MTSRREFFGLLAAAPLVSPVVVKEIIGGMSAAPYASGGFISVPGWAQIDPRFQYVKRDWNLPCRFPNAINFQGEPQFLPCTEAIPNRLYGTQINADGEAV